MKKFILFFGLLTSLLVSLTTTASADVNDFIITKFNGDYTLSKDDLQGKLKIREQIQVIFSDQNHGILRAIPKSYKDHSVRIEVQGVHRADGREWPYSTYSENDNLVLKIGDPDRTVTGAQTFIIDYTAQNVVTFYDGYDELYWDINGDQWRQQFTKVSATFHLPSAIKSDRQKCFSGGFGSTEMNCRIINNANGSINISTTKPLNSNQTLTAVLSLPKNYFRPATFSDNVHENIRQILSVILPSVFFGGWAYRRWLKYGKDPKDRGVTVPEYDAPNKLTPAEVGVLSDYRLDNKDISATIIDLAVRGYIKINEIETKKLIGKKKEYQLELVNPDLSKLKLHEQTIIKGIFSGLNAEDKVNIKDLKNKFYLTVSDVREKLLEDMTTEGYFASNPSRAGNRLFVSGVIALILAAVFHNWLGLGFLFSAIPLFIFGFLMPSRTDLGVRAKEHVEGLKLYLKTAEEDRIKMLQSPSAPYAEKSTAPVKTVKLFEKLLPFAVLLGVEKEWAKQFEGIYTTPPDWYGGSWNTFNTAIFASSLNDSVGALGSSFSAPTSSSGSGFSSGGGGGFSGGGGGGGGGGGW